MHPISEPPTHLVMPFRHHCSKSRYLIQIRLQRHLIKFIFIFMLWNPSEAPKIVGNKPLSCLKADSSSLFAHSATGVTTVHVSYA